MGLQAEGTGDLDLDADDVQRLHPGAIGMRGTPTYPARCYGGQLRVQGIRTSAG